MSRKQPEPKPWAARESSAMDNAPPRVQVKVSAIASAVFAVLVLVACVALAVGGQAAAAALLVPLALLFAFISYSGFIKGRY